MSFAETCSDKESCILRHNRRKLFDCQNRQSSFLRVDYSCIPNTVPSIPTIDICTTQTTSEKRGFIQSSGFPSYKGNLDCKTQISVNEQNKVVNIYTVSISVSSRNFFQNK